MISIEEAKTIVEQHRLSPRIEERALEDSLGLVLAEELKAPEPLPRFDNSAMDGYAVALPVDFDGAVPLTLPIAGESQAGIPHQTALEKGTAVEISTGAVVPEGVDLVVPVEETEREDGSIVLHHLGGQGAHIRKRGEEIREGDRILEQGSEVTPPVLAWCASFGISRLKVYAPPKVAILTTGQELVEYTEHPGPGQIRNSNQLYLESLMNYLRLVPVLSRRVPDSAEATVSAIREAMAQADIIVISGGVSVGPHDHVKEAAEQLGFQRHFWKVAQKPGKPLYFASAEETILFGLPGNPVSTLMSSLVYLAPVIQFLMGKRDVGLPTVWASLAEPLPKKPSSRARFLLVRVEPAVAGSEAWRIRPAEKQQSHMLSGVTGSDGFIEVPPLDDDRPAGEEFAVSLFPWSIHQLMAKRSDS